MVTDLSIVTAAFNEGDNIGEFVRVVRAVMADVDLSWELIIVDDGSTDGSVVSMDGVRIERHAHNRGQQAAWRTGLSVASGRAVITLDSDLQHPPSMIPAMVATWREGAEVVWMLRRASQGRLSKDATSAAFYAVWSWAAGVSMPRGSSDFLLLDRTVVQRVLDTPPQDFLLRAEVRWLGVVTVEMPYELAPRWRGEPSYTFRRSLELAVGAIRRAWTRR